MDARLIGDSGHMLRLALRESKLPFYRARMMFSDEIKNRTKMMQVTFLVRPRAVLWLYPTCESVGDPCLGACRIGKGLKPLASRCVSRFPGQSPSAFHGSPETSDVLMLRSNTSPF